MFYQQEKTHPLSPFVSTFLSFLQNPLNEIWHLGTDKIKLPSVGSYRVASSSSPGLYLQFQQIRHTQNPCLLPPFEQLRGQNGILEVLPSRTQNPFLSHPHFGPAACMQGDIAIAACHDAPAWTAYAETINPFFFFSFYGYIGVRSRCLASVWVSPICICKQVPAGCTIFLFFFFFFPFFSITYTSSSELSLQPEYIVFSQRTISRLSNPSLRLAFPDLHVSPFACHVDVSGE